MTNKNYMIIAALMALSLVLGACAPEPEATAVPTEELLVSATATSVSATPITTEEEEYKEVKIALLGEPNTLDPLFVAGRLAQGFPPNIFDSLTAHNVEGGLVPSLAVSWEILDETTWQFKLREGVTFHNGEPFNAECVKVTFDRILDPENKSPMVGRVGPIERIEIVDDYTVNIITERPDVLLPVRLSENYGSIVPAKYVQEVGNEGFAEAPIGTGPFKFVEWIKDERLVFEVNEDYWRGPAKVDRITIYPIKEDAARIAALLTGEVDIIAAVPAFQVDELDARENIKVVTNASTRFFFLVMRTDMPPFNDVRVRQALNYALDVPTLIEAIHTGYGSQIATVCLPQAFGYDPTIDPYPYDVEKAKDLLAEAGYPDGFDSIFDAFTGSIVDHAILAEAIAGQLADAGMRFRLNIAEFGVFKPTALEMKTNPLYIYSYGNWSLDCDDSFYLMMQGKSGYYYDDPDVLELSNRERGTFDRTEREKLLKELQEKFYDEAPYGYLYQIDGIWAMKDNVDYIPRIDEVTLFYKLDINQ